MSAELYDAEMAGALARPAIDVLPTKTRKGKAEEHVPEAPSDTAIEAVPFEAPAAPELEVPATDDFAEPIELPAPTGPAVELAPVGEVPAPRKVFGMALTRSRKPKAVEANAPEDVPFDEAAPEAEAEVEVVPVLAAEPTEDVVAEPATELVVDEAPEAADEAPPAEIVALAPSMPDHTEEVRAMRALLEASEQVRQAAEARTAAAEAQLRTVTNTVQEWQIRHREAEATITELAGSLAGAEGRMAELHQQLSAVQAERDELVSQLDAATSPATS